ncbi:MAG: hypothetical protein ACOYJG_12815 [Prevotella sp.]|jgi:hypothetical protein
MMKYSALIFCFLLVVLNAFSGEKRSASISAQFLVSDTVPKNLSDTSKTFALPDVVVKGSNVIQKSDRLILIPSSNMQKASSSAWDLLNKIKLPGVIVDRQNKSATTVDGGRILFKINNVDATIDDYLTIAPNDVKKVEYIDKPGARYSDMNISAIINVLTKRHTSGGQFGVYEDAAVTTMSLYNSAYVKFNNANSLFSLSYNSKYRDYDDSYTDTYLKNEDIDIFRKGISSPYGYFLHNINAMYNYQKDNFLFNARLIYSINHNTKQNSSQEIYYNEDLVGNSFTSPKDKSHSPTIDLFSEYKISKKQSLLFNMVGKILWTDYNYAYTETMNESDSRYEYGVDGKRKSLITEVMYSNVGSNLAWNTGVRYKFSDTHNKYSHDITDDFDSKDHNLYAYTQLSGNINKIYYMGGIGVNWVKYKEGDNSYERVLFRPLARIKYMPLNNMGISYDFSMRPVIPSLSTLSGITKSLNEYEFETGNSALRPYNNLKHKFSWSWNPNRWYFSLNYTIETAKDLFAPGIFSQDDKIGYQRVDFDSKLVQKIDFYTSFDIIRDMLYIDAYFSYNYYRYKMEDERFSLTDYTYGGKIVFYLGNFSANVAFNHTPKELSGMKSFYGESTGSIDCSYRYKGLTFSLGLWNPFKNYVQSSGYV